MKKLFFGVIILSILFIIALFIYSSNVIIFYILLGVLFSGVFAIVVIFVQEIFNIYKNNNEQAVELLFLYKELDMMLGNVLIQNSWHNNRQVDVGYISKFCQSNYKNFSESPDFLQILFYVNHIYFIYNKYPTTQAMNNDKMWTLKYRDHMGYENLICSTETLMEEIEKIVKEKNIKLYGSSLALINSFHHQIRTSHPPLNINKIKSF